MNDKKIFALYLSDGSLVGVTNEDPVQIFDVSYKELLNAPDLNKCRWNKETLEFERTSSVFTKLQFLSKFTIEERVAIRVSNDIVVQDFLKLIELAEYIDVEDERTKAGIHYLKMVGLITQTRAEEILSF